VRSRPEQQSSNKKRRSRFRGISRANDSLRFKNGYVLAYDFDFAKVWAWDRNGKMLFERSISIPDATHVQISDMAAASNGAVAVSASAMDDHSNVSPVIFWINSEGSINRIVRTAPFAASRIVFASDGSLWAAGRVYTIAGSKIVAAAQYDVLRRYNSQGELQQTAIPNTLFDDISANPAIGSFLASSPDRIGFLSVNGKKYFELSVSGKLSGSWTISSQLPENQVGGMALTSSGAVFISMLPHADSRYSYEGPPLYQLDKASGTLQAVRLSTTSAVKPTVLLGSDGDHLVFYSKPPSSVSWFSVQ
jgi:hypothetical protein